MRTKISICTIIFSTIFFSTKLSAQVKTPCGTYDANKAIEMIDPEGYRLEREKLEQETIEFSWYFHQMAVEDILAHGSMKNNSSAREENDLSQKLG